MSAPSQRITTSKAPSVQVEDSSPNPQDPTCLECVALRARGPAGRAQYDYHHQKVHRELIDDVQAPGLGADQEKQVKRDTDGTFVCPTGCGFKHAHANTLKRHAAKCPYLSNTGADGDSKMINSDGTLSFAYLQGIIAELQSGQIKPFEPTNMRARTQWNRTTQFMETLKGEALADYVRSRQVDRPPGKMADIAVMAANAWDAGHRQVMAAIRTQRQLMSVLDTVKASMARPMGVEEGSINSYRTTGVSATLIVCQAWLNRGETVGGPGQGMRVAVDAIASDPTVSATVGALCDAPTVDLVHQLWFHLLTGNQDKGPRQSVLCVMLAALAIDDPAIGSFKTATIYTPMMSRVLYALRCGFYPVAMQMSEERMRNGPPGLVQAGTELLVLHKSLLSENSNPTNGAKYIVALRAYGRTCARVEAEQPQFVWNKDGLELAFRGIHMSLDVLRQVKFHAIDELKERARDLFEPALALGWKPSCDFSKLTDDPANATPGFSFVDLEANKKKIGPNRFSQVMLNMLRASGPVSDTTPPQIPWKEDDVRSLATARINFLKALSVALHLTNRPLRGTEAFQSSFRNPPGGRARTFFLGFDGELIQDVTNNKSDYMSSKAQHNIRIVHPVIAELLLNFLVYAQPLFDLFDTLQHGETSCYLWHDFSSGKAWPSSSLTRALQTRYLKTGAGLAVGLRAHRQIDTAVDHKHERERSANNGTNDLYGDDEDDDDDDDDESRSLDSMRTRLNGHDLLSLQTGRSLMTTMANYGLDASWRPNVDPDMINLARQGSDNYSRLWGLDDLRSTPGYKTSLSPLKRRLCDLEPTQHLKKRARSEISTSVGSFTHTEGSGSFTGSVAESFGSSATSASHMPADLKTVTGRDLLHPPQAEPNVFMVKARHPLPDAVVRAMIDLYGRRPGFKGFKSPIVADALQLCIHTVQHFLLVARTGAGKSALWQILAKMGQGFSVIAAPYTALTHSIAHECDLLGLSHTIWKGPDSILATSKLPKVVIVSYNHLVQPSFLQWATLQAQSGRLSRIFIDEAHVIVEETYRWVVRKMSALSQLRGVQLVLMSATVPKDAEELLERRLCTRLHVLREPTQRLNLKISVGHIRNKQVLIDGIQTIIEETIKEDTKAQVLIVCRYLDDARELAGTYGVGYYHSAGPRRTTEDATHPHSANDAEAPHGVHQGLESAEKAKMVAHLQDFMSKKTKVLVGTCSVGVGVHSDNIQHVIFYGTPWNGITYEQNAGRAGRDGKLAYVSVFSYGSALAFHYPQDDDMDPGVEAIRGLMLANKCLRIPISHYLDGKPVQCLELGGELCSVCERKFDLVNLDGENGVLDSSLTNNASSDNRDGCEGRSGNRANEGRSGAQPAEGGNGNDGGEYDGQSHPAHVLAPNSPLPHRQERIQEPLGRNDGGPGAPRASAALFSSEPLSPFHFGASPPTSPGPYRLPPCSGTSTAMTGSSMDSPSRHVSTGLRGPLISTQDVNDFDTRVVSQSASALSPTTLQLRDLVPTKSQMPQLEHRTSTVRRAMHGQPLAGFASTHVVPSSQTSTASANSTVTLRPEGRHLSPHSAQLASLAAFKETFEAACEAMDNCCPVCVTLGDTNGRGHTIRNCPRPGFAVRNIISFRKNSANGFPPKAACWKCALPQDICQRANQDATCRYARHADAVRAVMMLLCQDDKVRRHAAHASQQFGPLLLSLDPQPLSAQQVGAAWLQVALWKSINVYKVFPLVAALVLRLNRASA